MTGWRLIVWVITLAALIVLMGWLSYRMVNVITG